MTNAYIYFRTHHMDGHKIFAIEKNANDAHL